MPDLSKLDPRDLPLVRMQMPEQRWTSLNSLLHQGFYVFVKSGLSLHEIMVLEFKIPEEYIQDRIQTVFMDCCPVDDVKHAYPGPGSSLALSIAMPGLAGALMRKGGYYALLRNSISHQPHNLKQAAASIPLQIKLFNFLAGELAENFLGRGVFFENKVLKDFVQQQKQSFWAPPANVFLQDKLVKIQDLERQLSNTGYTGLQVSGTT